MSPCSVAVRAVGMGGHSTKQWELSRAHPLRRQAAVVMLSRLLPNTHPAVVFYMQAQKQASWPTPPACL